MKKSLLTIAVLLVGSMWALAQAPPATTAPAQQKKEIKDPAEYNAYVNAIQTADNNAKAASLEAFLQQYPNSVMKPDALEALMAAYQASGNTAKTVDAAQRILQADNCNVRALALLAYLTRSSAEAGQNTQQNAQQAGENGRRGLQCLATAKPAEGQSAADFDKFKNQLQEIFAGSAGFSALQTKDYPAAQQALSQAVQANPTNLRNVYPLAVAYLEQKPPNPVGLYYAASAVNLAAADPQAQKQINQYAHAKYVRYHGGEDGYPELLAQAKQSPLPPQGFTVAPAPSPAEQAAKMLQTTALKDMGFADFQFILTSGNQQAADQLWAQIKDKPIQLEAKLITATPSKLTIAGSADDIDANKADIELTMATPVAKGMPAAGTMIQFQGVPVTYDPNPFMMHMEKGIFVGPTAKAVAAAGAAKKPAAGTARRRPPTKH
jgi:hypothetical protein